MAPKFRKLPLLAVFVAGLITALAWLAVAVHFGWFAKLDAAVANWFHAHRSRSWDCFARTAFHHLGPTPVLVASTVCGALLSWRSRSFIPAVIVTGTIGIVAVAENTLKAAIVRAPWTAVELHSISPPLLQDGAQSFPSGHVAGNTALLGLLVIQFGAGRNRVFRTVTIALVAAYVLLVGFIVLYVDAHCFSDVLGGMVLGAAAAAVGSYLIKLEGRLAQRPRS